MRVKRQPAPPNASGAQQTEALAHRVGARVRQARLAAGLSQEALAAEMRARGFNWRQTTVAKMESAARPTLFVEIAALGQFLGRDMAYFYSNASVTADLIDRILASVDETNMEVERLETELAYASHRLSRHQCAFSAAVGLRGYEETLDSGLLRDDMADLTSKFGPRCLEVHYVFESVGVPSGEVARLDAVALRRAAEDYLSLVDELPRHEWEYESGEYLLELSKYLKGGEADRGMVDSIREDPRWAEWLALLLTDAVVSNFVPEYPPSPMPSSHTQQPTYAQVSGHD